MKVLDEHRELIASRSGKRAFAREEFYVVADDRP
jgi:hypothetical protein